MIFVNPLFELVEFLSCRYIVLRVIDLSLNFSLPKFQVVKSLIHILEQALDSLKNRIDGLIERFSGYRLVVSPLVIVFQHSLLTRRNIETYEHLGCASWF